MWVSMGDLVDKISNSSSFDDILIRFASLIIVLLIALNILKGGEAEHVPVLRQRVDLHAEGRGVQGTRRDQQGGQGQDRQDTHLDYSREISLVFLVNSRETYGN